MQLKRVLLLSGVSFLSAGCLVVSAYRIRGWDYPWDPSTYYQQTVIDAADTANPSFFMRDLGWNGGNVFDLTRHIKNELAQLKFVDQIKNLAERLGIDMLGIKKLLGEVQSIKNDFDEINSLLSSEAQKFKELTELNTDGGVWQTTRNYRNREFDYVKQAKHAEKVFSDAYSGSQDSMKNVKKYLDQLNRLTAELNNVEGEEQLNEIRAQIAGVQSSLDVEKTKLLAYIAVMNNERNLMENADIHEARKSTAEFFGGRVEDPFNVKKGSVSETYEKKSKAPGFVRFGETK